MIGPYKTAHTLKFCATLQERNDRLIEGERKKKSTKTYIKNNINKQTNIKEVRYEMES